MRTGSLHKKVQKSQQSIALPVYFNNEEELEAIEVRFSGSSRIVHFKVETFSWHINRDNLLNTFHGNTIAEKLMRLKAAFEEYEKGWEVAQIFTPDTYQQHRIRILLRKETK